MVSHRSAELLTLQDNCKRDAESYRGEFELQRQHYAALLQVLELKPEQRSPELGGLVSFLAHVSRSYPTELAEYPAQLCGVLEKHGLVLQPQLRGQMVQALILLRRRGAVTSQTLLPLCFRLFECHDKALRSTLHGFIIADVRSFNAGGRNDRLNRSIQNYLYKLIETGSEHTVKRALGVLTELWRRKVWRDARTVNVIASATLHQSPTIMLAALKFFLGQDMAAEDEDDGDDEDAGPPAPTKDDVYRAHHKGTPSTKKKKARKLKRVMSTLEKTKRRGQPRPEDSFAAMQLLHDPQTFAERLLARCQKHTMRFEARLVVLQVVSRAIGVHELILENFYPFIQRYLQPSQREVVAVLAVAVQACHKLVPPDALRPVLKQLVDGFVHDKARPEVMTVGLKTVREMCVRCPLVMDEELLSDLVLYQKERDKHVKNAAKALATLFRELKPSMLQKNQRGRAADLSLDLPAYGAASMRTRVDGAELLEAAIERGDDSDSDASERCSVDGGDGDDVSPSAGEGGESEGNDSDGSEAEVTDEDATDDGDASGVHSEDDVDDVSGDGDACSSGSAASDCAGDVGPSGRTDAKDESLAGLKRRLAASKTADAPPEAPAAQEPIEFGRVLTQEDFERIRKLKVRAMVEAAMAKHGLKSASARARMKEQLYEEMEARVDEQGAVGAEAAAERMDPTSLLGKRRGKADKAERMATVMAGREGREEFGSSVGRKKRKAGGLSNVQQKKRKVVLAGAAKQQSANRKLRQRQKNHPKHQRGRASRGAWD